MVFCGSCGAALKPGAKFCAACGTAAGQIAATDGLLPPTRGPAPSMRVGAIAVAVALVFGLGSFGLWKSGLVGPGSESAGNAEPSADELAEIAGCISGYKAALMMQQDGGDLTEDDLKRQAQADCAAMTSQERAAYGQGAASDSAAQGEPEMGTGQVARLDITPISYPFSGASCVFSSVIEMSDTVGGNDYGEDVIRFGVDGITVQFEPLDPWTEDLQRFRSSGSDPLDLTVEAISDVGKSEEEYGYPASQWLVEVTVGQAANQRVHRLYRFCGDG